jgi:hypothetical protein
LTSVLMLFFFFSYPSIIKFLNAKVLSHSVIVLVC